jgi:hypothetical protein
MATFTIDTDNNVTAYTRPNEAAKADASLPRFSTEAELAQLAADWPADRLIDLWNSIPGNSNLTKLGPKAAARIWKALQPLAASNSDAPKPAKAVKPAKGAKAAKETAKKAKRAAKGKKAAAAKQANPKRSGAAWSPVRTVGRPSAHRQERATQLPPHPAASANTQFHDRLRARSQSPENLQRSAASPLRCRASRPPTRRPGARPESRCPERPRRAPRS